MKIDIEGFFLFKELHIDIYFLLATYLYYPWHGPTYMGSPSYLILAPSSKFKYNKIFAMTKPLGSLQTNKRMTRPCK
jgi:hypothetical protein